jgi:hypothetical protein
LICVIRYFHFTPYTIHRTLFQSFDMTLCSDELLEVEGFVVG